MKSSVFIPLLLVSAAFPAAVVSAVRLPVGRQVADLKSFFHGEPAPSPKAPPPPVTATVTTAVGVMPDPQVEDFFRAFAAAVKARDGAPMLPRLSDRYTIADLPEDRKASDFFVMGVERTPGPETIVIQSIERKGAVRVVKAEIHYPAKTAVKTFKFDDAGRLVASDLFMLKRVEHGM
jgi:hypothetical protein